MTGRAVHLRLVLVLEAVALGAAGAALVLALGLPLAARAALDPARVLALAAGVAVLVAASGSALLLRNVGRPVERLLDAAEALGARAAGLPLLGAPGEERGRGLSGAAVAFERLARELASERARLAQKVLELERADAALVRAERLATVGRLASGIAHEVGNPLGAIGGYVELARDRLRAGGGALADADDFLSRIGAEAQRIDRIVRDLLDLARPAEPLLGAVTLAAPVEAAVRLAQVQGRFRGVDVQVELAPDLPAVSADERRLAQVLLNLLLNAGDAMGGAGRVRVIARSEGEQVVLEVRDSGPGIPAGDLPRVFDPFFSTKPAGQGTGLGLAISLGIVESFGGTLGAANAPEGGAVFTLRLRRAPPERAPRAAC